MASGVDTDTDTHTEKLNLNTCFNKYFSSIFTVEDIDSFPDVKSSTAIGPDLIDSVHFTLQAVYDLLYLLCVDKACGPDVIPARLSFVSTVF